MKWVYCICEWRVKGTHAVVTEVIYSSERSICQGKTGICQCERGVFQCQRERICLVKGVRASLKEYGSV